MRSCSLKDLIRLSCAFVIGYAVRNLFDLAPAAKTECPVCSCAACQPCPTTPPVANGFESFRPQLRESYKPKNIYDVLHYEYMSGTYAYDNYNNDPKIGLLGHQKSDLTSITEDAASLLSHTIGGNVVLKQLNHAYRRFDPARGEELLLDVTLLKDEDNNGAISDKNYRLEIVKPFRNAQLVRVTEVPPRKTIHFIVPVYNSTERLKMFMDQYEEVCLKNDENCYLLVVLFKGSAENDGDKNQAAQVNVLVADLRRKYEKARMRVVQTSRPFSRGLGLNLGIQQFPIDYLLFFCDVDVVVMPEFLDRCRNNAALGERVYYPTVFSLYDESIVKRYSPPDRVSNLKDINKYTGHWVHYGFGMVCLYGRDYHDVGGFDTTSTDWGGEDVYLYRKHVRSNIKVIRAMDPGLIHVHHKKSCDPKLDADKLRQCRDSQAESLGSRTQLAKLALEKDLI